MADSGTDLFAVTVIGVQPISYHTLGSYPVSGRGLSLIPRPENAEDCPVLEKFSDEPERWMDVGWNSDILKDRLLPVRIKVALADQPDSMPELMTILAQQSAPVSNLSTQKRGDGWIDLIVDIEVREKEHLEAVLQALRSSEKVSSVSRIKAG